MLILGSSAIEKEAVCLEDTLAKLKGMYSMYFIVSVTFNTVDYMYMYYTDMRPPGPHFMEHHKKVTKEQFLRVSPYDILHCTDFIYIDSHRVSVHHFLHSSS